MADIESMAQHASCYAADIEHLSIAAECILSSSSPADPRLRESISMTILSQIKELAQASQDATVGIEQALLDGRRAPQCDRAGQSQ